MLRTKSIPVPKNFKPGLKILTLKWDLRVQEMSNELCASNWPRSPRRRMAVGWMFCYLWLLDVLVGHTRGHSLFSCEPIILRMCQDLPYNTTFMPNLLNHYDQQTAALAMEVRLYSNIYGFGLQLTSNCGQNPGRYLCFKIKMKKVKKHN